jgi:hypothetical protein
MQQRIQSVQQVTAPSTSYCSASQTKHLRTCDHAHMRPGCGCEAILAVLLLHPLETLLHKVGMVLCSLVELCTALQQVIKFKACCCIESKVTLAVFTLHLLVDCSGLLRVRGCHILSCSCCFRVLVAPVYGLSRHLLSCLPVSRTPERP